ncbi:MAG: hypothetical protein AMK72_06710 [Planctomycetes bacterium SM23_25]|nr:MAG: hypothetical protein AMK72_06710 [Planctomycetes bacterium SM23_25]
MRSPILLNALACVALTSVAWMSGPRASAAPEVPIEAAPPEKATGRQTTTIVAESPEGTVAATAVADPGGGAGAAVTGPMTITVQAGGPAGPVTVPALGIGTAPPGAALRAQLGLEDGCGLVVEYVAEKGPAAEAGIAVHDILLRLNEEPLRTEAHLGAMLRRFKAGQEVRLTFLRAGLKQTATVKVAEVPAAQNTMQAVAAHGAAGGGLHVSSVVTTRGVGQGATTLSKRSWSDGGHTLHLTERGERKTLLVQDSDGGLVFSGPVDSEEQRKALPAEVRTKLERMEARQIQPMRVHVGDRPVVPAPAPAGQPALEQGPVRRALGAKIAVTMTEDGLTLTLTADDARHHLLAKDKTGEVVFDGPVETDEQRQEVPERIRDKLERLAAACGEVFFGK